MNMYAKDIEPKCALCQMGEPIPDTLDVLCKSMASSRMIIPARNLNMIFLKEGAPPRSVDAGYSAEDFRLTENKNRQYSLFFILP